MTSAPVFQGGLHHLRAAEPVSLGFWARDWYWLCLLREPASSAPTEGLQEKDPEPEREACSTEGLAQGPNSKQPRGGR